MKLYHGSKGTIKQPLVNGSRRFNDYGPAFYATRDLAAAFYRKKTYNFDMCLYVVAYQQNLHFKQWFKVVEMMGYDWAT